MMPLNDTAEANVWFNPPDQARVRAGARRLARSCGFAALLRDLPDPAELPIDQVRPIRDEIEHRVRGSLYGMGVVLGAACALGLVTVGLFLLWNLVGWQWRPIFLVNVPVGAAALIAARFVVRASRSPAAPRLDLIGVVLVIASVLMLVYPLTEGRRSAGRPGPSGSWRARWRRWRRWWPVSGSAPGRRGRR